MIGPAFSLTVNQSLMILMKAVRHLALVQTDAPNDTSYKKLLFFP